METVPASRTGGKKHHRLLLSPAPSYLELHKVVASWGCESGCGRFCHFQGGPLQQPARLRASWMDSSRCLLSRRGLSAAAENTTTSRHCSVMSSTGFQSHRASSRLQALSTVKNLHPSLSLTFS